MVLMNKQSYLYIIFLLGVCFNLSSCWNYKLKGISIDPAATTYYVSEFRNITIEAPSDIHRRFSEKLREKIRNETNLKERETDADILFEGSVTSYNVIAQAAKGNDQSGFQQFKIGIKVKYTSALEEKDTWEQEFSFFKDFDTDQNFQDVEDDFVEEIFLQITEDIFNKAFTNW